MQLFYLVVELKLKLKPLTFGCLVFPHIASLNLQIFKNILNEMIKEIQSNEKLLRKR